MARIELEGDETDETKFSQKTAKAKPGKPSAAPLPRKKQVAPPITPLSLVAKKPVAPPAEQPEERLTAEEWAERLKAEEEAKQQEAYPEEAEEQEDEENKLMTKEEFLAYMQKKGIKENNVALTTQKPANKRGLGSSLMNRLSANINDALGITPTPTMAMAKPIITKTVPPTELPQKDSGNLQELDSNLQEITGGASDWMGLKSNPILAGFVALIGLIMVLSGTFMSHDIIAALTLEIMGLIVFVFGLVFVYGHVRRMIH